MNSILISSGGSTTYEASAGFFFIFSHDTTRCEISMASLPLHPDSRQNETSRATTPERFGWTSFAPRDRENRNNLVARLARCLSVANSMPHFSRRAEFITRVAVIGYRITQSTLGRGILRNATRHVSEKSNTRCGNRREHPPAFAHRGQHSWVHKSRRAGPLSRTFKPETYSISYNVTIFNVSTSSSSCKERNTAASSWSNCEPAFSAISRRAEASVSAGR